MLEGYDHHVENSNRAACLVDTSGSVVLFRRIEQQQDRRARAAKDAADGSLNPLTIGPHHPHRVSCVMCGLRNARRDSCCQRPKGTGKRAASNLTRWKEAGLSVANLAESLRFTISTGSHVGGALGLGRLGRAA